MSAQYVFRWQRAALGLLMLVLAGGSAGPEAAQQAANPPPVPVGVITTAPENLPITNELPGRIAPTRIAEVRPRVSGIIVARVFTQGAS